MQIPRIKLVYILLLVFLALLLVFGAVRPMTKGKEYGTVQMENIVTTDDGWAVKFQIVNPLPKDTNYKIQIVSDGGSPYIENVLIPEDGNFTLNWHVYQDKVKDRSKLTVTIYKEQEPVPFEEESFYLDKKS